MNEITAAPVAPTIPSSRFWDKLARKYAASPIKDMETYEVWLARVAEHLGPDDQVLEVGCGTGSTALRLAPGVKSYLSTDYSAAMIEIADEKLKADPVDNLRFLQADPFDERLEMASGGSDSGYDAALAFSFLHLTDDPQATVQRISALLKPGGLFISKTVCIGPKRWLLGPLIAVMRLFGKAPRVHMMGETDVDALMEQCGFEIIEKKTYGKSFGSRFLVARKLPG
jgi:ubiquinone/menaquinone biosynthesis C-methylase UbiE